MNNPLNPPLQGGLNIKVNTGAKAARFVVDLKNDLPKGKEEAIAVAESRLEKLAEVDYGKMLKKGGEQAKSYARNFWIPAYAGMTKGWSGMTKKRQLIPGQVRNDVEGVVQSS